MVSRYHFAKLQKQLEGEDKDIEGPKPPGGSTGGPRPPKIKKPRTSMKDVVKVQNRNTRLLPDFDKKGHEEYKRDGNTKGKYLIIPETKIGKVRPKKIKKDDLEM